jgi:hypothetical protein
MLKPEQKSAVAGSVTVQRVILLALIGGASAYLAFVLWQNSEPRRNEGANLPVMAAGFAAMTFVASLAMPPIMAAQHRRAMSTAQANPTTDPKGGGETSWLLGGLQSRAIVRAALLEGGAYFNIFVYQVERQPYSLAISVALLLAIAVGFPFRRSTEEWLERELRFQRDAEQLRT